MTRALFLLITLVAGSVGAQRVPLTDPPGGGLYENGANQATGDHFSAGMSRAALVKPIDGRIILLSIGMSNTTQEFCATNNPAPCQSWSFVGQATADPEVNHATLVFVNGARGGQSAETWESPSASNYNRIRDVNLVPAGLTEQQVQVAWVKVANPGPTVALPAANADAYRLVRQMGNIARALKTRYPNIQLVYFSSRIYAGYATSALNPEPYAYESGLAVKWLVQAQIEQMRSGWRDTNAGDLDYNAVVPWIAWGPYLWANGSTARGDGLTWEPRDFQSDGTHPSTSGQQKVGSLLLAFFKREPTARGWFLSQAPPRRRAVRRDRQ